MLTRAVFLREGMRIVHPETADLYEIVSVSIDYDTGDVTLEVTPLGRQATQTLPWHAQVNVEL